MVSSNAKLLFRLGLATSLASICFSAYILARAQTGPEWEVPVAVVEELRTIPRIAIALAIVAAGFYFWQSKLAVLGNLARSKSLVILLIAFALPFVVWVLEPEQWPFQYEMLSFFASILMIPVWLVCVLLFWLVGFRRLASR